MSLRNILNRLAADEGLDIVTQRDYVLDNINAFARDLHNGNDLAWSDREEVFVIDYTKQITALPWQVMVFHAARDADRSQAISTVGLGPRYRVGTRRDIQNQYRVLRRSPIKQEILSGVKLSVHLPKASAEDIVLNIVGRTTTASQAAVQLTVPAGALLATTTEIFESITNNIEKQAVSDVDLTISSSVDPTATTAILAEIPNHQLASSYLLVQHGDYYLQRVQDPVLEVWYKHAFVPFVNDFDSFICTDIYDNAITLGAQGRLRTKTKDQESIATGLQMMASAVNIAVAVSNKERESQDEEVAYPTNVVDTMHENPQYYFSRDGEFCCHR